MTPEYSEATQIPWQYDPANPSYWKGMNTPIAVVLHIMQGYASTATQWAQQGYTGASWGFTVARDGNIQQHLGFGDGGYHAGVVNNPTWKLYSGTNPNWMTIGIEHEGFSGEPFPDAQINASAKLTRWILDYIGQPADRDHVIGHYEIDAINRPNDPGPTFPWDHYMDLIKGDDAMTPAERAEFDELKARVDRIDNKSIVLGPDQQGYDLLQSIRNQSDAINAIANTQASTVATFSGKFKIINGEIEVEQG